MKQIGQKTWLELTGSYRRGFIVFCISLLLFVFVTILSWWSRCDLYDQQAAARWSDEADYAQLSCFYPVTMQPTDYDFQNLYHTIESALKAESLEAETENAKLFIDAYSMTGSLTLSTDNQSMKVKAVGVTDNFFVFHPVSLLQGSYFDEDMIMKDGVIIDEDAAFTLYGSNDVVGMPVYVENELYYIRGVVERESTYLAREAGLDSSICYVSADTLSSYGMVEGSYTYEVIMPNPVEGFAKNILVTALNDTENKLEVIENSNRFSVSARKEIVFDFAVRSMSRNGILYPYWENQARAHEDICGILFIIQAVSFCIVFVLLLWYIWHRYKTRTWRIRDLWEKCISLWERNRKLYHDRNLREKHTEFQK